ncbi:DUF3883 domain-containing protein [Methylibium sp.]|uniref:DUF3883 domain-containing protein n=1 Tax=Methylibium sp. TaxID=2067992 RepID=UPI00333E5FE0
MPRTLADLSDPAAVQAALDEYLRLGQAAFLERYGFGRASGYVVRDPRSGQWADSKAIAGVAVGFQFPAEGPLQSAQFSGGTETVVRRLKSLGFDVRALDAKAGENWLRDEVELIVADYLAMLLQELAGQPYNKAAHRRQLQQQLPARSEGSIEFKHANISAVMLELGYPYIRGYQPRSNFQRDVLVDVVQQRVRHHRQLDDLTLSAVERPAVAAERADFERVLSEAPRAELAAREVGPAYLRAPVKRDYFAREAQNRSLGEAGELFALNFERWRLAQLGAGQFADKVRHVSLEEGDGLGYDIRSFEPDGRERFIEVKTTGFGERTPFYVSANEARFARDHQESFRLYRLFDFRLAPRLFELAGPIEQHCLLDATTFRASFG